MRRWGVVAGLALGRLAFGLQYQSVASAGPELAARFGLDYAGLGALIGLFMVPGVFTALPSGLLGRRFGEKWVVGAGLVLMTAGGAIAALATGAGGVGWGRVVGGAGAVAVLVMQGKVIADRFSERAFMVAMGVSLGAFPLGVGLAGVLVGPLGWPGLAWAGSVPAALGLVVFMAFAGPVAAPGRVYLSLPSRHECALVLVAGLIWTVYNGGYYAFLAYMPSWMAVHHHPAALTAMVLAIATWLNMPFTVLGGAWAARSGAGVVFLVGTAAAVVALGGLVVTDWPLMLGALFGTVASLHVGIIMTLATYSARPQHQAVAMGLFYTLYYLGGALLPVLCGRAADLAGDPSGALLAGAVLAALCLPAYALHRWLGRHGGPTNA